MIVAISQYMEALGSPDGRMRSLRRVAPVYDGSGMPVFAITGRGSADFKVTVDGRRCILRCPLSSGERASASLRTSAIKDRGLGGRFFTEWKVLEQEIVLFDGNGASVEVDVLIRPAPESEGLEEFMNSAVVRANDELVDTVRRSFEELVAWVDRVGRHGISLRKLRVTPDGALFLTGFSAADERERIARIFLTATPPEAPVPPAGFEEWVWDETSGLAAVMAEGRWGVADRDGRLLTSESYDWLGEWSEGLLLAQKGDKCGFLDVGGREAIPFVYDDASSFSEGCALVSRGGESFFIDPRGHKI